MPSFYRGGNRSPRGDFCLGSGADLGRGQGPSADGGPLGARRCGRAEVAGRSRTLRGPNPSGPWARPPSPDLPAVGAGGPGAAPEPGRLYLPRPRRLRVSAARAPGVICSRPAGPLPAFPPGRGRRGDGPLPPYHRPPGRLAVARVSPPPSPGGPLPDTLTPQDASSQGSPSPDAPLRVAPSGAKLQGALSPRGTASEKGVRFVLFLKDKPNYA